MRILIRRSGGIAGLERHAEVDTATRPDAAEWHALAEEALAHGHHERPVGVPDGFTYQITADDRTVYCADPRLTEAQSALISRVMKEGVEKREKHI